MPRSKWPKAMLFLAIVILSACGGGGGGAITTPAPTSVSGVISKAPVSQARVSIFSVSNGQKGSLLKTVVTDANGAYFADLGSYSGPLLIEAVGGSYIDEATGALRSIATPLRAAIDNAQGEISVAVTPLTEVAVRKAANFSPEAIKASNVMISSIFKFDIITTIPAVPSAAALQGVTEGQKDYTLALAAVSQMVEDGDSTLESTLASLAGEMTAAGISDAMAARFQRALSAFVSPANPYNKTGITDTSGTNLGTIGVTTTRYQLALSGDFAAAAVNGIEIEFAFPEGVSVKTTGADSSLAEGTLLFSPGIPADIVWASSFRSGILRVAVLTTTGISAGELGTLTCQVASGTAAPAGASFNVRQVTAIGEGGKAIPAVTVTVN